jgi:hypothetical protein
MHVSVTALPTFTDAVVAALVERRAVAVVYHGRRRVVCPHAIGCKGGRVVLLAYQIGGQTSTGSLPEDPARRWRRFFVDEIEDLRHDDGVWQSADNYDARPFLAASDVAAAV